MPWCATGCYGPALPTSRSHSRPNPWPIRSGRSSIRLLSLTDDEMHSDGEELSDMIASSNPDACILIIDDEPGNVKVLKRVLAVAGYHQVTAITDPRVAIARFAEIDPDILLLDLHMPEIDGVTVMKRLRAGMTASEYFPILMLTGDDSPQACQRALAMGASDFVAKPFDMHEVLIRIRNLLATRSLHRQVAEHAHELERKVRER